MTKLLPTERGILQRVYAWLPEYYGKYSFAQDAKGDPLEPMDPRAVTWCLQGAVYWESPKYTSGRNKGQPTQWYYRTVMRLREHMPTPGDVGIYSDNEGLDAAMRLIQDTLS